MLILERLYRYLGVLKTKHSTHTRTWVSLKLNTQHTLIFHSRALQSNTQEATFFHFFILSSFFASAPSGETHRGRKKRRNCVGAPSSRSLFALLHAYTHKRTPSVTS